ncbi:hypothetical protein N7537_002858 [Penicillium hordei]|uniref:Uncharacterized protein n=1 Tax=Penicillium hordei TaxID=40994 RepID=A0AAD6H9A4_9EURO|nr:uncharacterized protein N7537_002858 [Penicillium hordei]KAJ5617744.1 hypothetical protein N7537_002858 [Penicillium hordei]
MVVIASYVFGMILLRPQINEHILQLRLWKDGHSSTAARKRKWIGSYQSCIGPDRALLDPKNKNTAMKGYTVGISQVCGLSKIITNHSELQLD